MSPKQPRQKVRRQPQRTCIACRQVQGKRALLRIVRTPDGVVELDPTGRKSGRGAYVHASAECVRSSLSGGALSRALKVPIDQNTREELESQLSASLPAE